MTDKKALEKKALVGALQDRMLNKILAYEYGSAYNLAKQIKKLKGELNKYG